MLKKMYNELEERSHKIWMKKKGTETATEIFG